MAAPQDGGSEAGEGRILMVPKEREDMDSNAIAWLVVLAVIAAVCWRLPGRTRRPRRRVSAGAAGAVYDMLNKDKRNALEVIVEDRAAAGDPEDRDGNLPDLERPKKLT